MKVNVSVNGKCELVVAHLNVLDEGLNRIINPCDTFANVYVEFLINPNLNVSETLKISTEQDFYTQVLPKDGLYVYYCIKTIDQSSITDNYLGLYFNTDTNTLFFNGKQIDFKEVISLLPSLGKNDGVEDYIEKCMFSICNLKKCMTKLQKESIVNWKNGSCNKSNDATQIRDFLFISIYILESLICEKRYSEALDLLNSISMCVPECNMNQNKKCNCNG